MKKLVLLLSLCFSVSFLVKAQSVANTIWLGYDSTNTSDLYWNFTIDSLRYSPNNINYTTVSSYTQQANIVRIVDISTVPGLCAATDTGIYVTVFSNDTMWLNLFSDPCTSRVSYMTTHYFLNMAMGVPESIAPTFSVYPNPMDGICTIECTSNPVAYQLSSIDGKILESGNANKPTFSLDMTRYPAGAYIVTALFENSTSSHRIVRY